MRLVAWISDMSKYTVQRAGNTGEIQRLDQQGRVSDLAPGAAAHEASKLLLSCSSEPCRLLLEGPERSKVTLSVDDLFHGGGTEGADQLVLQVGDAHVETESFKIGASEVGAEAGPLEAALEVALLCSVVEARESGVKPLRAEPIQEASDVLRTSNRNNGNALSAEIPTTALG